MPQNKNPTQATESPRAPPLPPVTYDCIACCYIIGKSGRVCGVCIKKRNLMWWQSICLEATINHADVSAAVISRWMSRLCSE